MKNKEYNFKVIVSEEPITENIHSAQERAFEIAINSILKNSLINLIKQDLGKDTNKLMLKIFKSTYPDCVE